ncbi:MAG: DNA-deoxyinosine glycosylase [Clostridia bacterium]|jgi:hypoxanthine-DNA glycosylase|nr:DNA-deoxyinosine glycosylase [Clostridia bacterium]
MEHGFAPVYGKWCRVLILGSFPSVRSRAVGFYYGHPQNRFWKTVCGYFGESVPETISGKTDFLMRRGIALWDVVEACEIEGSSDASIREESVGDLKSLFDSCGAEKILCNGSKSFQMLEKHYPELLPYTKKLSSTSPANPRFSEREWFAALQEAGLH